LLRLAWACWSLRLISRFFLIIIVLWPKIQVRTDSLATVQQQQGCWDAYGQSSPLYATKQAPQIIAVKAMIDSLLS
jgi:hypothetical protein